jgi:hypothetical protein
MYLRVNAKPFSTARIWHILVLALPAFTLPCGVGVVGAGNDVTLIERLDRNGDGALDIDEIPPAMIRLRNAFAHIDADGDGRLTEEEFAAVSARQNHGSLRSPASQDRPPMTPPVSSPAATDAQGEEAIRARMYQAIYDA